LVNEPNNQWKQLNKKAAVKLLPDFILCFRSRFAVRNFRFRKKIKKRFWNQLIALLDAVFINQPVFSG